MISLSKFLLFMITVCSTFLLFHFDPLSFKMQKAHALEGSNVILLQPDESLSYMKERKNIFVLDVRDRDVAQKSHLAGSVNIPADELADFLHEVPRDRPILIHCHIEKNAKKAVDLLHPIIPDHIDIAVIRGKLPFE